MPAADENHPTEFAAPVRHVWHHGAGANFICTALLFNGIGTLLYLLSARLKSPHISAPASPLFRLYCCCRRSAMSSALFVVKKAGSGWIDIIPPAAIWAIVAVIGLELAGVAANMASLLPGVDGRYRRGHIPGHPRRYGAGGLYCRFWPSFRARYRGFSAAAPSSRCRHFTTRALNG
ncbi:MAG: hypothetical protein GPOALKHO_000174 [Sodalis sp.]|nr:MAG: hypothetical protein GPOALKHO_000174 [Sodalis sp.]